MSRDIVISLIIPIYNAEKYIIECLESVKEGLPSRCEVLLIDDGSIDRSVQLIENIFNRELNSGLFRLIHIENSGPGGARNVGLEVARGQYIAFLDADDRVLSGYFDAVLSAIAGHAPDVIQFNLLRSEKFDQQDKALIRTHTLPSGRYELAQVREDIFRTGKWFPCARIYRRTIFEGIRFPASRVFYEDIATIPKIFLNNLNLLVIEDPLIWYRVNPYSTTNNRKLEHLGDLKAIYNDIKDWASCGLEPLAALRIQLARTIIIFAISLHEFDNRLLRFTDSARLGVPRRVILSWLNLADKIFLIAPRAYAALELVRQKMLNSTAGRRD